VTSVIIKSDEEWAEFGGVEEIGVMEDKEEVKELFETRL
jgi:hypothetical protein